MGMPADEIREAQGGGDEEQDERFGIWPENEHAKDAFLIVRRQWRMNPMGGFAGLDYPGVEAKLRMCAFSVDAALLADLDAIEGGALEVFNARGEK